jgi:hypothetical protein
MRGGLREQVFQSVMWKAGEFHYSASAFRLDTWDEIRSSDPFLQ